MAGRRVKMHFVNKKGGLSAAFLLITPNSKNYLSPREASTAVSISTASFLTPG